MPRNDNSIAFRAGQLTRRCMRSRRPMPSWCWARISQTPRRAWRWRCGRRRVPPRGHRRPVKFSPLAGCGVPHGRAGAAAPLFIASPVATPLDDIARTILRTTPMQILDFARRCIQPSDSPAAMTARVVRTHRPGFCARRSAPSSSPAAQLGMKDLAGMCGDDRAGKLRAQNIDARPAFRRCRMQQSGLGA